MALDVVANLHDLVIAAAELLMPVQGLVIDHFAFAHRTPVLDSRNQSIALPKELGLEGPGQLAQLFKISLEKGGTACVYKSEFRIICPTASLTFSHSSSCARYGAS
jgi:hypothetical protein